MTLVRRSALVAAMIGVSLACPTQAFPQQGQDAALTGTVRDRSHAVLPGVTLTVRSPQLIGGARTVVTDAQGVYRFPLLAPGTYELVASLHGFARLRRQGIVLPPGLEITVDFDLELSTVMEAVEVGADVPVVDVASSSSESRIDRPLLENLPLVRDATVLMDLTPGVTRDVGFGGTLYGNAFTINGASASEMETGEPAANLDVNWIQEVQVVGVGGDAQYGETTGVAQNLITRSGGNQFSGLGQFWTVRPAWLGDNRGGLSPALSREFRPLDIYRRWDGTTHLGGPIQRDRLWFFGGVERYVNDTRPAGFTGAVQASGEPRTTDAEVRGTAKLTAALSSNARIESYYQGATGQTLGVNASPLIAPEAFAAIDSTAQFWNGRLLATLGSSSMFSAGVGFNHTSWFYGPPQGRRDGPPGHYDLVTNINTVNFPSFNDQVASTATSFASWNGYFASGTSSHDVKFGAEFEYDHILDKQGWTGGAIYSDNDGQPYEVTFWPGSAYRPHQFRTTVYGQDSWRIGNGISINPGVRVGFYGGDVPGLDRVLSTHSVAPRLGVAWDIARDHSTVVRAHYGRYYDPLLAGDYEFLDPASQTVSVLDQIVGPGQYVELSRSGGPNMYSIDPNVRLAYASEYVGGVEREIAGGISGTVQYVHRSFDDVISWTSPGSIWSPVQRIDPGPDGKVGTADDRGPITIYNLQNPGQAVAVLTNPPQAYRHYDAVQFVGRRRYRNGWELQASYTWARTRANFDNGNGSNFGNGNDSGSGGVFADPNRAINSAGRTSWDLTHDFKVLGTWQTPFWGVSVSGVFKYQSNRPWGRTVVFGGLNQGAVVVRAEPRIRELPAISDLDLRLEKTLAIGARQKLGLFVDTFNLTNQGGSLAATLRSGPNFGLPIAWIDPRTVQAGARFRF